jgi:hypothetical protein
MALKKKKSKNPAKNRTKKAVARKAAPKRVSALSKKAARGRGRRLPRVELAPSESETRAAGQAGGLQGLSDVPDADSESVDELLEEGNALEAGIVEGVEDASDADEDEVRTHEVPEDDVPDEYLHDDEHE